MAKSVNSKLRTLYIMQELFEKSDEDHRLSTKDLIAMLESNSITADRKSIYDDIETLSVWGMDILYTKEKPSGYYLASRDFELPELKLLVDAVQSSKFITEKKSRDLIKKLESLTSNSEARQLQRHVYIANRIKTQNESIYYNVDKIHEALLSDSQIQFTYYKWSVDKELIPRNEGKPFVVSPWALTWDDENYYMIGYDQVTDIAKHYRVDKMQKIELTEEKRQGEEKFVGFDIAKFAKSTFGMYGGEHQNVTLECENEMIGAIIDRFGTDIIVQKVGDGKVSVTQEVAMSGQFFGWIVGLGSGVKIVAPQSAVQAFIKWIDNVKSNY